MSQTSSSERHFHTRDEAVDTKNAMGRQWALYECSCGHIIGWRQVR